MNNERTIGEYTANVSKDDYGRIVAEVWHTASGKTVGITECATSAEAWHWARKTVELLGVPA